VKAFVYHKYSNSDKYYVDIETTGLARMAKDNDLKRLIKALQKVIKNNDRCFYIDEDSIRLDMPIFQVDNHIIETVYFKNNKILRAFLNVLVAENPVHGLVSLDLPASQLCEHPTYKKNLKAISSLKV